MSPLNFDDLPLWGELLVCLTIILGFFVALAGVIRLVPQFWHATTKFMNRINALGELPEFIARTDKTLHEQNTVLAEQNKVLKDHTEKIGEIQHEVQFNNGSSVKDAVTRVEKRQLASNRTQRRIEKGVAGLYDRADAADDATTKLRKDFDDTHPKEKP